MGIFENFPYTNFHRLNLDWLLKTVKKDHEIIEGELKKEDNTLIVRIVYENGSYTASADASTIADAIANKWAVIATVKRNNIVTVITEVSKLNNNNITFTAPITMLPSIIPADCVKLSQTVYTMVWLDSSITASTTDYTVTEYTE